MSEWESQERLEPNIRLDEATCRRAALAVCDLTGTAEAARPILEALGLVQPVGAR